MTPTLLVIALALAISVQATPDNGGDIMCHKLDKDSCAYAVSSSGKRCVLEKCLFKSGYTCTTSEIVADKLKNLIETEECISACGVDRQALGISSDSLLDRTFARKLCSNECYRNCPNIVDLYFNLAAGEGVFLPKFCEAQKSDGRRREMAELFQSSGKVADAPTTGDNYYEVAADTLPDDWAWAPAPAPAFQNYLLSI